MLEVERLDEQPRVADLAAAAAAEEAPELLLDRPAAPLGLLLQRAERAQVSLGRDNLLDGVRAERADQLVLEIGVADEEAERFEVLARQRRAEARVLETAAELPLLAGVAETAEPEPEPARSVELDEAADRLRAADRQDDDPFRLEIASPALGQRLEREAVTQPLDEDDGVCIGHHVSYLPDGMRVEVNGTRLWFDVDGAALLPDGPVMRERPTVVLLHGGPGSFDHSYFKPDFARLADVAQVVYLDLLGHGRSDWGDPDAWTFELAADAVRDFCDALDIGSPVVLGHSLGAFVALEYAVRHPAHPRALVLNGAFARFDLARLREEFRRAGGDEVAEIAAGTYSGERPATADEWARVWRVFGSWVPGDVERERTVANRELNANAAALIRSFDVLGELPRIACPTLVVVGELDPITPVSAAREIVDAIAPGRGRLEIVEGAGHFTWRDAPDSYWPLLTDFVESLEQ